MNRLEKKRSNMSMNVIGGLVSLLLLFGVFVSIIGNHSFTSAFKNEYASVTHYMADSVAVYVNGSHIDRYLAGEEQEEYELTKQQLDTGCHTLNVSLIYVIQVDRSDYGRFVSVFNVVNNSVDDSAYTPWELGYRRDTSTDEYRQKYRAVYEQGAPFETVFRMHPTDGQHPHITTMVPVKNAAGDVTAILCMQRPVREMAEAFTPYLLTIIVGVFVMLLIVSRLAAQFLRKSIIHPVETVSAEATRFAKEHSSGEPIGEISKYEVICNLVHSIDSMETDMLNYIDNLTAVTAEKERIGAELSIASTIQNDALPAVFPPFPDRHEFDIYALMDPAKEVGGDFYNFFFIDDDHLALVMADVSGKGIPAALFMMGSNSIISERAHMGGTPAEILGLVNRRICEHIEAD
nr:SpoIIE family protein phosphatase [Clostridiales bacterium]